MKGFRMADSAAALVQLGVSVICLHGIVDGRCTCGRRGCRTPGKHPDVGSSWKRFRRKRADLALVRRWFTQKPYANVGIVTGEISAILVLDADGEAGVTELERRGYPTTDHPCRRVCLEHRRVLVGNLTARNPLLAPNTLAIVGFVSH